MVWCRNEAEKIQDLTFNLFGHVLSRFGRVAALSTFALRSLASKRARIATGAIS